MRAKADVGWLVGIFGFRPRYLRALFRDLGAVTGAALAGFRSHTARISEKACEITG
jgi:hypothetical protein